MRKYIILLFVITYVLSSCKDTPKNNVKNDDTIDSLNLVKFAKNFKIIPIKSGYKLVINNTSSSETYDYYIFNDSIKTPDEVKDQQIIKTPIKSAITFSSTQWSVFQMIGEISKVKGILEGNYSRNSDILTLVKNGTIEDVGFENNIDIEKLIKLQSDIILYTPYPSVNYNDLEALTTSVLIPFPDYLESHPLGRAEWMKVIGLLCGKEKETEEWFDKVVNRYESLSNLCLMIEDKPTVFSDLPFKNQWYVPGGHSYIAKLFNDAGGDYIWKDNLSTGSLHIDAESVLLKAQQADYWRVINSYDEPFTYEKLERENELYPLFKAFKEKQLLVCNVRECGYFEQSQYEPDVLLADFIYHFHPELLENEWKNYTPKYFKRLIK